MNLLQVSQTVANLVQAFALLVGGAWVYFKFIRGRTFARRGQLDVSATVTSFANCPVIRVQATFTNAGLSRIPLEGAAQMVDLQAAPVAGWTPGANLAWLDLMTADIFASHSSVEAQEAITDEVMCPASNLAGTSWLAYRVEVSVWSRRRSWRFGQRVWQWVRISQSTDFWQRVGLGWLPTVWQRPGTSWVTSIVVSADSKEVEASRANEARQLGRRRQGGSRAQAARAGEPRSGRASGSRESGEE